MNRELIMTWHEQRIHYDILRGMDGKLLPDMYSIFDFIRW